MVNTLREKPELAIFLTLSIGYLLGKIRISSFELGSVTGVLLAGILPRSRSPTSIYSAQCAGGRNRGSACL